MGTNPQGPPAGHKTTTTTHHHRGTTLGTTTPHMTLQVRVAMWGQSCVKGQLP